MNSVHSSYLSITPNRPTRASVSLKGLSRVDADQKWEALHTPERALSTIKHRIESEQREVDTVSSKDIRFRDDGIAIIGGEERMFSENGFKKLVQNLSCGGASFLLKTDPDIRALALNRFLDKRGESDLAFHTRTAGEGREVFSVTGPNFPTGGTALSLIEGIVARSPEESKAIYYYDPNVATVSYETVLKLFDREQYRIGDIHQGGVQWLLRDAGFGSILPSFKVYRHACANLMLMRGSTYDLGRAVHRGSMDTISANIQEAFDRATGFMDRFHALWVKASNKEAKVKRISAAPELYASPEVYAPEIYTRLLSSYKGLVLPNMKQDQQVSTYVKAFNEEPAYTWQGIINGITHAAKDRAIHISDNMQEAAGQILNDLTV